MRKVIVAAGAAMVLAGGAPASAMQAGAPAAAPIADGHWGPSGWVDGAAAPAPAPMPASASAPAVMRPAPAGPMAPGAMPPPYVAPDMTGRNSWGNVDRDDYRPIRPGQRLKGGWLDPRYTVNDWQGWGLGRPGPGMRWIRYHDVALLIDPRGRVVDESQPLDWDVPHTRTGPGGVYAAGDPGPAGAMLPPPPLPHVPTVTTTRTGNTVTTVREVMPEVDYAGYGPGAIVTVTPGTITTTTTTTVVHGVRRHAVRRAPSRSKLLYR